MRGREEGPGGRGALETFSRSSHIRLAIATKSATKLRFGSRPMRGEAAAHRRRRRHIRLQAVAELVFLHAKQCPKKRDTHDLFI